MTTVLLRLHKRDDGRAFANDRSHKLKGRHPLEDVNSMSLVFCEEDFHGDRHEQVSMGLLLDGNLPEGTGHPLDSVTIEERFAIRSGLMLRESPVPYRMRMLALEVDQTDADKLTACLEKNACDRSMFIGTLTNIFVGRSELDEPPMKYLWRMPDAPYGEKAVFVFLHVNFHDNPGLTKKVKSDWRRLDDALLTNEAGIKTVTTVYRSFADLWPLFQGK